MSRSRIAPVFLLAFGFLLAIPAMAEGQQKNAPAPAVSGSPDPVLQAMSEELSRAKTSLQIENLPLPYYVEYHLTDLEEYAAEAAFGALRSSQRTHVRGLRVVVRVGDYKQDSYYGQGLGVADLAPLENDPVALRRAFWLATDRAYKAANQALASKKATLSQYTADQPFDDLAHAPAVQSIGPLVKMNFDPKPWNDMLVKSSALFTTDPQIEYLATQLRSRVVNKYFANSEGTITRQGSEVDSLSISGSTQAADGMRLDRSPSFVAGTLGELPSAEKLQAETAKVVATLRSLREAPMVEEDYRGPVLFGPDAATDIVTDMIAKNIVGMRPKPGESARTIGSFASSYKSRVLPAFLSVVDDPTMSAFQSQSLIGSYEFDDEGVRATKVSVIENGELVNYLLGRQPIRDFPDSNGHGRAAMGQAPISDIGNLILTPNKSLSPDDLKKKLLELCRDENKPYCYYVETLYEGSPRLLYRIYVQDGRQELVRGAIFDELDTRSLRNDVVAAGNDPLVSNRDGAIPATVISPSILFDELEVRRSSEKNGKLPEYGPPALVSSH